MCKPFSIGTAIDEFDSQTELIPFLHVLLGARGTQDLYVTGDTRIISVLMGFS